MSKLVYSWGRVTAGDIISFRYKGKDSTSMLQTVLVFNPKIPNKKKDGTKSFHLIGLKLENRGVIPTIKSKPLMVQLLERIGGIEVVSGDDFIYRVNIPNVGPRGVKRNVYNKIKRELNDVFSLIGNGFGSTYDFEFLPIRIDYIFISESISASDFKIFDKKFSDHKPISAFLKI